MNVLIPMGGLGSRFKNEGYRHPKPLINIFGRPMIMWLIDRLSLRPESDTLWVAHMGHIEDDFGLGAQLKREYPQLDIRVVLLNFETRGAAETLYIVCQAMTEAEAQRPTLSLDCDTIYFHDILSDLRPIGDSGLGAVVYFEDKNMKAIYSYIETESESSELIVDVREKVKISDKANSGAYMFRDALVLRKFLNDFLDMGVDGSGEYYTSAIIKQMLLGGEKFKGSKIEAVRDFQCVGTPPQLRSFLNHLLDHPEHVQPRRFCFDLDCTLVTLPEVPGDYSTVRPIERNIRIAQQLHRAGHYIIIHTARRMRTHKGNVDAVIAEIGDLTRQTLEDFKIPCDELRFGKPYAHVYIDDLAVHSTLDTQKEIGLFLPQNDEFGRKEAARRSSAIMARSFNDVQIMGQHVIKTSSSEVFSGEVAYYERIPEQLQQFFPKLHSSEVFERTHARVLTLEKIEGPTFSHLLTSRCLTKARFLRLLAALKQIHDFGGQKNKLSDASRDAKDEGISSPNHGSVSDSLDQQEEGEKLDLYSNYGPKLQKRFDENFDIYEKCQSGRGKAQEACDALIAKLAAFQKADKAVFAQFVHGDPVFSNVLLDRAGKIKLIDMRGKVGSKTTTSGDVVYDLAKVFQSLCGYDFILTDKPLGEIDLNILSGLKEAFGEFIAENYPKIAVQDIKLVSASLYFSLIPLHDRKDHRKHFFEKAEELLNELKATTA